jgi:biopolymer transport protein ExbD
MSFAFAQGRRRRRPSLTPMIDVVFLLLVFFMLVARFGQEGAITLTGAGGGGDYRGPPRIVEVRPGGLSLNGTALPESALLAGLAELSESPDDTVILRPRDGATLQALVDAIELLSSAGLTRLVLVE